MRRIRYEVAASLDGFISGPNGEIDWLLMDEDIDFGALFGRFDTLLMGRKTYEETVARRGLSGGLENMKAFVFSRTLNPDEHPEVTIVEDEVSRAVSELREQPGKDIWLFGGGLLCRSMLDAGLVDSVRVALMPVVLGAGVPLLPGHYRPAALKLTEQRVLERTGIVLLEYAVEGV